MTASLPPVYGGAEIAAWRYAQRLRRAGVHVVLIGPAPATTGSGSHPDYVHAVRLASANGRDGRRVLDGPELRLGEIALRLWSRMWSLRSRYDVVHVFNSRPLFNLMAVPPARVLGKPVILEMSLLGSDDPVTMFGRATRQARRRGLARPPLRPSLYRRADAYITKSPPLTEAYRRAGLPESKLRYIPYAVDTDLYRPAASQEKRALRSRLGLEPDASIALFVGGMNPRKGVHWLIDAFRSVRRARPGARLLIVGPADKYDGAYVESLHRAARAVELEGAVTFVHGLVTNVHDYMRASDVFVLPSVREGLPISVLEAMACGLGIVASNIPEIVDVEIRNDREGELVPVGDVTAMASSITRMLMNEELRDRLGRAARRRAEEEFSEGVVDAQYRELYETLLAATWKTGTS